jgi:RHS repeat-associated protein
VTWLADDHQGTAQIAITSDTLKVTQRRQDPFGAPRGDATFPGSKGFVGGTLDKSIGLTMLGAREYDPALGRFLSADPQLHTMDPQQLAGYTYGDNNPVTNLDPSGESFFSWVGDRLSDFGHGLAENRGAIAIGLGILAVGLTLLVPPAGVAMLTAEEVAFATETAITTANVINTGLSTWDMADNIHSGNYVGAAVDGLGLGLAGAGQLVETGGKVATNVGKLTGRTTEADDAAIEASSGTTAGVLNGASAAAATAGGFGLPAAQEVSPPAWACNRPGFQGPYPCQDKLGNPIELSWCHSGGVCACVAAPRAAIPPRSAASGPVNLGTGRPGRGEPTYNNPAAPNSPGGGYYQTNDGLYHQKNGHGAAMF